MQEAISETWELDYRELSIFSYPKAFIFIPWGKLYWVELKSCYRLRKEVVYGSFSVDFLA